jgi:hypothetical protein
MAGFAEPHTRGLPECYFTAQNDRNFGHAQDLVRIIKEALELPRTQRIEQGLPLLSEYTGYPDNNTRASEPGEASADTRHMLYMLYGQIGADMLGAEIVQRFDDAHEHFIRVNSVPFGDQAAVIEEQTIYREALVGRGIVAIEFALVLVREPTAA